MLSDYYTVYVLMCTKFGVDCTSRFRFRVRTDRQMRLNALSTPSAIQLAWLTMTYYQRPEVSHTSLLHHFNNDNNNVQQLMCHVLVVERRNAAAHFHKLTYL